jgi:hypothetical protein
LYLLRPTERTKRFGFLAAAALRTSTSKGAASILSIEYAVALKTGSSG